MAPFDAHLLTYYELHEIPWRIPKPVRLQGKESGVQFQIGPGPFWIPDAASPQVVTRAGGANLVTVNKAVKLEGGTFFGVAAPIDWDSQGVRWDELSAWSDDCAALVGLCLNQRFALQKKAQYAKRNADEGPRREAYRWQLFAGSPASISKRSVASVVRALDHLASGNIAPATLTALRWYEQSKRVTAGVDRLVALWIALEALMPSAKSHRELVKSASLALTHRAFALSGDHAVVTRALGLDIIRDYRNRVVHEGLRDLPWPVYDDATRRDWPQILNDIVAEMLRHRLRATKTRELNRHFKRGLELLGADSR